jgi:gas vesicle protein
MANTKLITGLLIGAGAALAVGYLMTDSGSEMRKKLQDGGKNVLDFLCDALDKGNDAVKKYAGAAEEKINDLKGDTTVVAEDIRANA